MRPVVLGLALLAALAGSAAISRAPAIPAAPPAVEVMVLGVYHFGNPGLDVVNAEAEDPTSPRRQRELAALSNALLKFRPTRVMVEIETPGPDYVVPAYRQYTPAQLASSRDESVQIGFRVARDAGLAEVQGIDERGGAGEPDYFPFDKVQAWAGKHGRESDLAALFGIVEREQQQFQRDQPRQSIPSLLMRYNAPGSVLADNSLYLELLRFGDDQDQPGAELNGYWYMRNAKIFAKLMQASRPGDRVLVIFGAGHGYWLRHFAANTPGFRNVEVMPYLRDAARRAGR